MSTFQASASTSQRSSRRNRRAVDFIPTFSLGRLARFPPEITAMIAAFLGPSALAACMQVSVVFRLLWAPYMYRSVLLVDEDQNVIFQESVVRRHFTLVSDHVIRFASSTGLRNGRLLRRSGVTNLVSLALYFDDVSVEDWLYTAKLVAKLVDRNVWLSSLRLSGPCYWFVLPLLLKTTSQLTYLELDLQGARLPPMTLQLGDDDSPEGGRFPSLRSLSLANFTGSDAWVLVLVRECQGLREVAFEQHEYWMPSNETRQELAHLLRGVKSVVWRAEEIRGGDLREVLELGSPESKSVSISVPEVDTLTPLIESAASIRSLTLDRVLRRADVQNELHRFLEAATKLEELRLQTTAPCDRWGLVLTPLLMFGSTSPLLRNHLPRAWSCSRTLTRLDIQVQIDYPPFRQEEAKGVYQLLNPMRFANDHQHKLMYSQLGLLVNLVHLRVGFELAVDADDDAETALGGFQRYSLLFSLRSGLRLLKNLTVLEVLDVRWTRHEIGTLELDWMHKTWPNMKAVLGLADLPPNSPLSPSSSRYREKEARDAQAWVTSHPLGIGCGHYWQ